MSANVALLSCALVVACVAEGASARALTSFTVETADLKIKAPASLAKTYDMAIANFGSPIYGATLSCVTHARFARAKSKIERVPISDLGENLVVLTAFSCKCDTRKSDHPSLNSPQGQAGVPQRQPRRLLSIRKSRYPTQIEILPKFVAKFFLVFSIA